MTNKVNQIDDWQKFWEVMGQNKDPIAATDRPTVSPETYRAYCREIEQKLELKPDDVLLDIGCGTGLMDAYLSSCVKKVFATDYAFNMARATGATTAQFDNTFALNCAAKPAPFPDQAFSKVLLYAVTQYLSPPEFLNILGELKRVTKPGGLIFFGEIPRGRDDRFWIRVKDVLKHEGVGGLSKKVQDRIVEIVLIRLGRYVNSERYIRPIGPPTWHPYPEELTAMVEQAGMKSRVMAQGNDLPWFHQTFDLVVVNQ